MDIIATIKVIHDTYFMTELRDDNVRQLMCRCSGWSTGKNESSSADTP
jgi:hypothetical protein